MVLTYVALVLLCLWGIKYTSQDTNREYILVAQTKSIQGIFTVLVLLSHASTYMSFENANILDKLFLSVNSKIGQLMVCMFFFYSGYGIMFKSKQDNNYVDGFLKKRFLPVYLKFVVCILFYIVFNIAFGTINNYSLKEILLSFVAWTKIGNSNWFMFVTFYLYLMFYFCFKLLKNKKMHVKLYALIFAVFAYILVFSLLLNKGAWWYNTILCFPLGMLFCYKIDAFEKIFFKHYYLVLALLLIAFAGLYLLQDRVPFGWAYCVMACVFCLIVVLFTVKFKVQNPVLSFFSKHIFSIYILQRIPYIFFSNIIVNKYLFFIVSFIVTIILSVLFDNLFDMLHKKILKLADLKQK